MDFIQALKKKVIILKKSKLQGDIKMTEKRKIAQAGNYVVEVEEGKTYYWCQCGESSNQPFCDGSHSKTNFKNVAFTAEKTGKVYLCGCKQTSNQPFCDGSHMNL